MPADAGYKAARAISQAARAKDWKPPSFGKGLYLGHFEPELISTRPVLPAEAVEKGGRLLAALGSFLQGAVDPQAIEPERRIPNEVQPQTERLFHELWDNADAPAGDGPMVPSAETARGIAIPIAAATTIGAVS